jgi:hypothetical protein
VRADVDVLGALSGRNTLTQLSTNEELFTSRGSACYTYAIQVELSKRLRKFLTAKENEPCLLAFATALVACVQSL